MEKYNYREVIKSDIKEWMTYEYDGRYNDYNFNDMCDRLYDDLWAENAITGNDEDYYDSEYKCEEYLYHNFDLLFEALYEFGYTGPELINAVKTHCKNDSFSRWADATIRCYLLSECLEKALKELGYDEKSRKN